MTDSEPARATARGSIVVGTYDPRPWSEVEGGPILNLIHVVERFEGDIEGDGEVYFVQAAQPDGTASFVGQERVTGSLGGRGGTFVLQDTGTVQGSRVSGSWFVVPGSGTGGLSGLRGEGGFQAELGQNASITLDYWFE